MKTTPSADRFLPTTYVRPVRRSFKALATTRFPLYENAFYAYILFNFISPALGISIDFMGITLLAGLAVIGVVRLRPNAIAVLCPLASPLLCAVSFIVVQVLVHNESLFSDDVRPFVSWFLLLIVVKSLCTRPEFLRRFTTVIFVFGLMVLPFLTVSNGRATLDPSVRSNLANSNALATWFAFCSLSFTIRGLENRQPIKRWLFWTIGLFCVFIVGLTVSRATTGALAVGVVIALRRQLNRSFLPVLLVIGIGGTAFTLGLFDSVIGKYNDRGFEETGRLEVWPISLQRFLHSPVFGVGVSNNKTPTQSAEEITPHNPVLFLGLSSGILPVLFYFGYWLAGLRRAWKASSVHDPNYAYLLPLLVYGLVVDQSNNLEFIGSIWSIVTVVMCLSARSYSARHSNLSSPTPRWVAR